MSKQEWKEYKREERQENMRRRKEQQERMDAGDERYLLARDIGPERRYARDWVDSRAFLTNWVMLIALMILGATLLGGINPHAANIISLIGMVIIVILAIEGVILGKRCNNAVRKKFPDSTEAGFRLGFTLILVPLSHASGVHQSPRWNAVPRPNRPYSSFF